MPPETGDSEPSAMSSAGALKAAKKNLRTLMKIRLSTVPAESIDAQSRLRSSDAGNC